MDKLLAEVLSQYPHWKQLPDGRYAAVSNNFTYGKCRIIVGIDYSGYSDAY